MASIASEFHLQQIDGFLVVQTCQYSFLQPVDHKGRPQAGVRSGLINLTLLGEDRAVLTQWGIDPLKALNGFVLFRDINGLEFRTLTFTDAYNVRHIETFNIGGRTAAYRFRLSLTARLMVLDDHLHDNLWSDYMRP